MKDTIAAAESMFHDACGVARRYYQMIPVVSIAIILFGIVARPTENLYAKAREQIRTALQINWERYSEDMRAAVEERAMSEYETHFTEFYRHYTHEVDRPRLTFSGYENGRQRLAADELEARLWEHTTYDSRFGLDMSAMVSFELGVMVNPGHVGKWTTLRGYLDSQADSRPVNELTPLDLVGFIKSPVGQADVTLFMPDRAAADEMAWRDAFRHVIQVRRGSTQTVRVPDAVVEARVEPVPDGDDWIDRATDAVGSPKYSYVFGEPSTGSQPPSTGGMPAEAIDLPSTSVAAWLATRWPGLGEVVDGRLEPFKGLEHVWTTIADRTLTQANLYIDAAISDESARTPSVDVVGLQLPAHVVPLAGPIIILVMLVQLGRLLGHLLRRTSDHAYALRAMAWFPLHAARWRFDAVFSLIVLPVAAQAVLTMQLAETEGASILVGWCVLAVALLVSLHAMTRLAELRRRVASLPADVS